MTLVLFLLSLGLTARLTRLVVDDKITMPIRDWFERHGRSGGRVERVTTAEFPGSRNEITRDVWIEDKTTIKHKTFAWMGQLVSCPWCFGVWAAAGVFATAYACADPGTPEHTAFVWTAAAATASYLVGVASMITYRLEGE